MTSSPTQRSFRSLKARRQFHVMCRGFLLVLLGLFATSLPAQIPFDDAVQVAAGHSHTCALKADGKVQCWGDNTYGQLGDGTTTRRLMGVPVSGLNGVIVITAGGHHTCAVTNSGAALCWGGNSDGQLGDGSGLRRLTPVLVDGLDSGVATITAGDYHTCAVTTDGAALCWGYNRRPPAFSSGAVWNPALL
ncbi:MAG: hypothetical protein J0L65_15825 [Xanthomonadales bacterium]|nr:hypothetical protein [Xanthomonadales bacterium]